MKYELLVVTVFCVSGLMVSCSWSPVLDAQISNAKGSHTVPEDETLLCRTRESISTLSAFPKPESVTSLTISASSGVGDEDLRHLHRFVNLVELDLSFCPITDKGIAHVKSLKRLRHLELQGTKVEGIGLLGLQSQNLCYLSAKKTSLTNEGARSLTCFSKLEYLDLSQTYITDEATHFFQKATSLKSLDLSFTKIGDTGLQNLNKLTNLEIFTCSHARVKGSGICWLGKLHKLLSLDLSYNPLADDSSLHSLKDCTLLSDLSLRGAPIKGHFLAVLRQHKKLRHLDLGHTQVTNESLKPLRGLPNLWSLDLSSTAITDEGLACIPRIPSLKTVNLSGNRITSAGLKHLSSMKISCLLLSETCINESLVESIIKMKELTNLGLWKTNINDKSFQRLVENLPSLGSISVEGTRVTKGMIEEMRKRFPQLAIRA